MLMLIVIGIIDSKVISGSSGLKLNWPIFKKTRFQENLQIYSNLKI